MSPGDSEEEITKGLELASQGMIGLMEKLKKLKTHSEKDMVMIINIPAEFKDQTKLFESSLKNLEYNEIRYIMLATDDTGKPF